MSVSEKLITVSENQEKIYQAGKNKEYDTFWDAYQQKGRRTSYINGFHGAGWTDDNFRPKYDIVVSGSGGWMFSYTKISSLGDVKLDLSGCTKVTDMFISTAFVELPALDVSKAADLNTMFAFSSSLKKVGTLKLGTNQTFVNTFQKCSSLKEISFSGEISRSIDFSACPLTPESMINIIMHLAFYKDTENQYKYTVKFSESCWEAMENSDYDVTEYNGSVACWQDYCAYNGWNT